jgi:ankyrin repeat protein
VLWHANAAAEVVQQHAFLSDFRLREWINTSNVFEKFKVRQYKPTDSLLYILAEKGFSNLIKACPQQEPQINVKGGRYTYPLLASVMGGHSNAVCSLLEHGVSGPVQIDTVDSKERTPLSWAVVRGHQAIVQTLIEHGGYIGQSRYSRQETSVISRREGTRGYYTDASPKWGKDYIKGLRYVVGTIIRCRSGT